MKSIFVFATIIAIALAQAPVNPVDQCVGDIKSIITDLKALEGFVQDKNWVKVIVTLDSISESFKDAQTICKKVTGNDILSWLNTHSTAAQKLCLGDTVILVLGVKNLIDLAKQKDWKQFATVLQAVIQQGEQTWTDCKAAFPKKFENTPVF